MTLTYKTTVTTTREVEHTLRAPETFSCYSCMPEGRAANAHLHKAAARAISKAEKWLATGGTYGQREKIFEAFMCSYSKGCQNKRFIEGGIGDSEPRNSCYDFIENLAQAMGIGKFCAGDAATRASDNGYRKANKS